MKGDTEKVNNNDKKVESLKRDLVIEEIMEYFFEFEYDFPIDVECLITNPRVPVPKYINVGDPINIVIRPLSGFKFEDLNRIIPRIGGIVNQIRDISDFTPPNSSSPVSATGRHKNWGSIDVFGTLWVDFGDAEISDTQRFVDNLRDMIEKKSGLTEKEIDELIIPQKSSVGLRIWLEFTLKDKRDN